MRDRQFVAEHRGGLLKKEEHRKLIKWACNCTEHVLPEMSGEPDTRVLNALVVAAEWIEGKASTGDAMKASLEAHAVARETDDPIAKAIARSAGQAVATAHMADHSLGAALYALHAAEHAGKEPGEEWAWQLEQLRFLVPELEELIAATIIEKGLKRLI